MSGVHPGDPIREVERPVSVLIGLAGGFFPSSVREALGLLPELEVVGEARGSEEVLAFLRSHEPPQVLLLNPRSVGVIQDVPEPTKTVVVTGPDPPPSEWLPFFALGAKAMVSVDTSLPDVVRPVLLVSRGMAVMPAPWLGTWVENHAGQPTTAALAPREQQLLELLAQGYPEEQIAFRLGLGRRTIQSHLMCTREKLGAINRVQAVALGVASGLVSPNRPQA